MSMIIDGTNGLTFNNATTQNSGGSVIQVVQGTYSTGTGSSSSTFSDTGLIASITPKFATSKILVSVVHPGCSKYSANNILQIKLLRSGSFVAYVDSFAGYTGNTNNNGIGACSLDYLDSPATTSSLTYKTQFRSQNGTDAVYICDSSNGFVPTASITLMEIAA